MGKHGPTLDEEVRENACTLAEALGKYSDNKHAEGPWGDSIALVARKLADQLWSGELDDRIKAITEAVWKDAATDPRNVNNEVAFKWTPLTSPVGR